MDEDSRLSLARLTGIIASQSIVMQQFIGVFAMLVRVLTQNGILTSEMWERATLAEADSAGAKRVQEMIERIQKNASIEDLLKDFEGPKQ
jgi:hypothetical protein